MKEDTEQLHSIKEVAARLGLGDAMTRRYAAALEAVTGEQLIIDRRDGRLFTDAQVAALVQARALVQQTNVDVTTALRQALEQPLKAEPLALAQSSALGSEALIAALRDAQREANAPLLDELKGIRESLERLEALHPAQPAPGIPGPAQPEPEKHGPVVRFALWLERVVRSR